MSPSRSSALLGLIAATWFFDPAARAQEPAFQLEGRELRVFPVRYASAEEVATMIQRLYEDAAVAAPDERANRVIVRAAPSLLEAIAELVERMDTPAEEKAGLETRIYRLEWTQIDATLDKMIAAVVGGAGSGTEVITDAQRNLIVLRASPEGHRAAAGLLDEIDRPSPQAALPVGSIRVRIVWLTRGIDLGEPREPSSDLAPVVQSLEKIGAVGLQQTAQLLVTTLPNGDPFSLQARVLPLEGESVRLQVRGSAKAQPGGAYLCDLQIESTRDKQPFDQMRTSVVAPPGHPVVLCLTPVDGITSVFVVQVLAE